MAVFVAGDVACAAASDFRMLTAARIMTALADGAFFGIASIVAAELAAPGRKVRAVAMMFTGLTVANVVGVPAGTCIGQAAGWRITFVVVAALAAASLLAIVAFIPPTLADGSQGLKRALGALWQPQIWLAMLVSTLSSAAPFTVLTFLAPLLEHDAGVSPHGAALALFLFGAGLTLGGLIGGRLGETGVVRVLRRLPAPDAIALAALGAFV